MGANFETLSEKHNLNFFVSYKWNDLGEEEADRICDQLVLSQINPIRDKICLKYGDRITEFMQKICVCDGVVLIINNDYLTSLNCMYEGITTLLNKKDCAIIRIQENDIYENSFKEKIVKYWEEYDNTKLFRQDYEKWKSVSGHVSDFISWISDTNSAKPDDYIQFVKQLKKHIEKVLMAGTVYSDMVQDLEASKTIEISRVCDPGCEESYQYVSIDYAILESPVKSLDALYNFTIILKKVTSEERAEISINNVAYIESGSQGVNFSKYYFCMPTQESLDECAFKEHIRQEPTELEYNKQRIVIHF